MGGARQKLREIRVFGLSLLKPTELKKKLFGSVNPFDFSSKIFIQV